MNYFTILERITNLDLIVKKENHSLFGKAKVLIIFPHQNQVIFEEKGSWLDPIGNQKIDFSNKWLWEKKETCLSLSHLRQQTPIHLFDFDWITGISLNPHICIKDCYQATLTIQDKKLVLWCKIKGPKKNEELFYHYSGF